MLPRPATASILESGDMASVYCERRVLWRNFKPGLELKSLWLPCEHCIVAKRDHEKLHLGVDLPDACTRPEGRVQLSPFLDVPEERLFAGAPQSRRNADGRQCSSPMLMRRQGSQLFAAIDINARTFHDRPHQQLRLAQRRKRQARHCALTVLS